MFTINDNFLRLQKSYLFSDIAHKVAAYKAQHPEAPLIRLGIGDVTRPLAPAIIEALHKATDEMAAQDTFLSIIDGNTVFQTEANEESRKAQINDKFNQFGRTWQIQNIYEIDGILHLSCQIVEDLKEVYTVEFINDVSIIIDIKHT